MRIHSHAALLFWTVLIAKVASFIWEGDVVARDSTNTTETVPSPLIVPASQYWDGDDGQWSSFALRVGTPAQDVRVLVSTNSPVTLVVYPDGCTSKAINPVPSGCANSRGGLFNFSTSSTWQDQGTFGINEDGIGLEANLGYSQHAEYGLETLGLGFVARGASGPTLESQTVAAIATTYPFWLGILGLSTQPVNFSTIGNFSAPSYFTTLRSQKLIPSLSWSFTAGAKYRLKAGQYAQLIFGGYDTSRYTPNSASFSLGEDISRDIVVAIQSITYSGTTISTLLTTPITAFIESTDPNIWLPEAACHAFEQAFGLSHDKSTDLYLINATRYAQLAAENPQVTFSLSNSLSGGETANIVLPFNAFALPATPPLTTNDTYYFPLKMAANDSQTTLGRAFLQEAYLTVDYERGNFSVSQCIFQDGVTPEIRPILSPSYANISNSTLPSTESTSQSKPVGAGVIAGCVIAGLVVIALAVGLGYFISHWRKRPTSILRDDIGLTNLETPMDTKDTKDDSIHDSLSPYPPYAKLEPNGSVHRADDEHSVHPELSSNGEIFQLPTQTDHVDYFTAVNRIASERRAEMTPQIDGRSVTYELYGSEPSRAEMDDEASRSRMSRPSPMTLSPLSAQRAPVAMSRGSSRSSTLGPVDDYL